MACRPMVGYSRAKPIPEPSNHDRRLRGKQKYNTKPTDAGSVMLQSQWHKGWTRIMVSYLYWTVWLWQETWGERVMTKLRAHQDPCGKQALNSLHDSESSDLHPKFSDCFGAEGIKVRARTWKHFQSCKKQHTADRRRLQGCSYNMFSLLIDLIDEWLV